MTAAAFAGFPPEAVRFYEDLALDNTREFFQANRAVFDDAVRAPMAALLAAVDDDPARFKVFRPNRDVRFSQDKSPYKLQHGAGVSDGGAMRYVQISADGLLVASGSWMPAPDQLGRMRDAIADDDAGAALERVLAAIEAAGLEVGGGGAEALRTAPRGFPRDHPRIELLRRKGLTAMTTILDPEVLETHAAAGRVRAAWAAAEPLNEWIRAHVGESRAPARGPGRR